jgi:hypothetical protein
MQETFTINQELKLSESLNVSYYIATRMRLMKRIFLFVLFIGAVNTFLDFILPVGHNLKWYGLIFDFAFLPFFILLFFSVFILLSTILIRIIKPNYFKNVTYRFTHWAIEKIGKNIEFTRPWNKVLKNQETKYFIFLYITENDAHIIQKRMFRDNEEIQNFKQFISQQIGKG